MRFSLNVPVFSFSFYSTQTVQVFDCENQLLGSVTEMAPPSGSRRFWHSIYYHFYDPAGALVGSSTAPSVFVGSLTVLDTGLNIIAAGDTPFSDYLSPVDFTSLRVVATKWSRSSLPGRPEMVLAMLNIMLTRYMSDATSSPVRDGCSQFIIAGIPCFLGMQLLVTVVMVCAYDHKIRAFGVSLLFLPLLALWLPIAVLGMVFSGLYAPFFHLFRLCGVQCLPGEKKDTCFGPFKLLAMACMCNPVRRCIAGIDGDGRIQDKG